jgi:hypothetical protein
MRLRTLPGDHPCTAALKDGSVKSDLVAFDFADYSPSNKGFKPIVREQAFDVYQASADLKPALKNQAQRFPERGINVRRLDHPGRGRQCRRPSHSGAGLEADRVDRGGAQEGSGVGAEDDRVVSYPWDAAGCGDATKGDDEYRSRDRVIHFAGSSRLARFSAIPLRPRARCTMPPSNPTARQYSIPCVTVDR